VYSIVKASTLISKGSRTSTFEGEGFGSGISFFWVDSDPGQGPRLHKHPYSETWAIIAGDAIFTADGQEIQATEGDIVVAGPKTPHKFVNSGDVPLRALCIHDSPTMIQTDLE
jgi:mannose-6-phosphate isomerase-like protein (cupin superfamily)